MTGALAAAVNITACFVRDTVECTCGVDMGAEWVAGSAVAMVRRVVARAFSGKVALATRCVESFDAATAAAATAATACDLVVGRIRQELVYDRGGGWSASVAYDADPMAVLYQQPPSAGAWMFLAPFSPGLWAVVLVLVLLVTPAVSSVVEYDEGESFLGNMRTYVIDGVHAYCGVDSLYHRGDAYSKESAFLAAVVAVVTRVLLAVYGCNLAAFVVVAYLRPSLVYSGARFASVASRRDFDASAITESLVLTASPKESLAAFRNGSVAAVAASRTFLAYNQECGEQVGIVTGPYAFPVIAYAPGFPHGPLVDAALLGDTVERQTVYAARYLCPVGVQAVALGSVYGMFVAVAAFLGALALVSAFRVWHCRRRQRRERAKAELVAAVAAVVCPPV